MINYMKLGDEIAQSHFNKGEKPTLLLHSCCAPCSTYCLEYLTKYFDVTVFYFNPNITDREEYFLRAKEQQKYLDNVYKDSVKYVEGRYNPQEFFDMAKGLEDIPEGGKRCFLCYTLRLKETATLAKEKDFDYFTSTLSISPYKNSQRLNEIGFLIEKQLGQKYFPVDFKKNNGYKRSTELSNEYGIYRQDYCGCVFSKEETEKRRQERIKGSHIKY